MRWKLANGGVIASSKQPLQHKDFDKLVVDYIECDEYGLTDQSIRLLNPSTNVIRKCHNGELYVSITPVSRAGGQAFYRQLPVNYYKIVAELENGWNDLSYSFTINEFYRNGVRGDIQDGEGFGHKCTIDRLLHPEDYEDYFDEAECHYPISEGGGVYYEWVEHHSSPRWRASVKDQMSVVLWKGPHRKHLKKLSKTITVNVDRNY